MAVPGPGAPEEVQEAFDAMPPAELAARWRMAQFSASGSKPGRPGRRRAISTACRMMRRARAYDMVLDAAGSRKPILSVRLRLSDVLSTLIHAYGAELVERIEADVAGMRRCAGSWAVAAGRRRIRRCKIGSR